MIEMLREEYDFGIPYTVARSALKRIKGLNRTGDDYTVISLESVSNSFTQFNKSAEIDGTELINSLTNFASNEIEKPDKELLEREFIKFILDRQDEQELRYGDLISRFCLSVEKDEHMHQIVNSIREGSILYCGLCYNIIETGSINDYLALYLDTEILFYLSGFNGQLSKQMTLDLIDQIKIANRKGKRITLTYFDEVKEEVDRYFTAARNIVTGKGGVITSKAMSNIVNGCKNESDVINKQTDFYYSLEKDYGIKPDENTGVYYNEENHVYNLESENIDGDSKADEAMRFISHINVLRKGHEFTDYTKCQFLIITETKKLIEKSDEQKPQGRIGYAVSISNITNILWLKLGGVFGKGNFPYNVNLAVKARMALGKSIATSANKVYTQTIAAYKEGKLKEDQAIARFLRLKEKLITPDSINVSNVDDLMDFSIESLSKYEDAIKAGEIELAEKESIISALEESGRIKDEKINRLQELNIKQNNTIEAQQKQIKTYNAEKEKKNQEKEKKQREIIYRLKTVAVVLLAITLFLTIGFLPDELLLAKIIISGVQLIGLYGSICTIKPNLNVFIKRKEVKTTNNAVNYNSLFRWIIIDLIILILCVFLFMFVGHTTVAHKEVKESAEDVEEVMKIDTLELKENQQK